MNYSKQIYRSSIFNRIKKDFVNGKALPHFKSQIRCCSSVLNTLDIHENNDFWDKIIYNEVLGKKVVNKQSVPKPAFLKYVVDEKKEVEKNESEDTLEKVHFPYVIQKKFLDDSDRTEIFPKTISNFTPSDNEKIKSLEWGADESKIDFRNLETPVNWARKYTDYLDDDTLDSQLKFGTSSPDMKVSKVPCGGCGALLHCNDPSIPGFIPAEIFEGKSKADLQSEMCQRCHYLREFQVSLGVNVSPSEYIKILNSIKEKEALAILMIDLLDFPCSIFPGIVDIIGPEKPLIIVGNKIDLLIRDSEYYLENFKNALLRSLEKQKIKLENIVHVALISGKTGYGVEDLISKLQVNWGTKGDVYLIGCTNVGKSTLFNTLIQSDYCKGKAINILQRATVSAWPGTTLNLLKFPIKRVNKSELAARNYRLRLQEKEKKAFEKFQFLGQNLKLEQIPLTEQVGITFNLKSEPNYLSEVDEMDRRVGLDPLLQDFRVGKWFYDTPGVVHDDQIINLLTTSELLLTVPHKMLLPRNLHVKPGTSVFIGGLARLDYISGADFVWFTVFASMDLPLTVTKIEDADEVYEKLLGTPLFRVPTKGKERLKKWPKLSSKKFEIVGKVFRVREENMMFRMRQSRKPAEADIVLSSAGWVAINVESGKRCKVEAWTPEGRGIYLRDQPIIRHGVKFKGLKIPGTPVFSNVITETKGLSIDEEPEILSDESQT